MLSFVKMTSPFSLVTSSGRGAISLNIQYPPVRSTVKLSNNVMMSTDFNSEFLFFLTTAFVDVPCWISIFMHPLPCLIYTFILKEKGFSVCEVPHLFGVIFNTGMRIIFKKTSKYDSGHLAPLLPLIKSIVET